MTITVNLGPGASVHKGEFVPGTVYELYNEVHGDNGTVSGTFRSKVPDNILPLDDTSGWDLVSKDGDVGPEGPEGPEGTNGTAVIDAWEDIAYSNGAGVSHKGIYWVADDGADVGEEPGVSPVWRVDVGGKDQEARGVLESFVEDSFTPIDYSAYSWTDTLTNNAGVANPNSYNKSIAIPISNIDRMKYRGRRWQSSLQSDVDNNSTIIGKKSDNTFVQLLPSVLIPDSLDVIDDYVFDTTGIVELRINRANANTYLPILSEPYIQPDAVRNFVEIRTPGYISTYNVLEYKQDTDADDRLCIQRAVNECFRNGGGKVFFPDRQEGYNLGSSLTSRDEVEGGLTAPDFPLAQIIIPRNSDLSKLITIEFEGPYTPNFADEAILSVPKGYKNVIFSERIANTEDGSAIMASCWAAGGNYSGSNYIQIVAKNLFLRKNTKVGSLDVENKMNGIDMSHVTQFLYDYIKIDTSSVLYDAVEPTSSIGLMMPLVNNKVQQGEGSAYIVGYNSGVRICEHFNAKRLIVLGCINGIEFPGTTVSYHSASITHLNIEACRNMIYMPNSNQVLNIFNYDVEHHNEGGKWYNYQYDILKTGGTGQVNIFNTTVVKSNVGNVNEFIVSGSPTYKVFSGVGANI